MATVALSGIITPTNVVTAASTTTLTNKTISGASNTLSNIPLSTAVTGTLPIANGGTGTTSTTFVNAATNVTGTLPIANGGTGQTLLSAVSVGTATNLAGGSNGTIPYQSASGTTQMLAVGTSGQVLQTNGAGAPTWVTPSAGAMVLLNTQTVTNTAGVNIDFISSTYTNYMLIIEGLYQTNGGNGQPHMRYRCSGTTDTGAAYGFTHTQGIGASWAGSSSSSDSYIGLCNTAMNGTNASTSYFGVVNISTFYNDGGNNYIVKANSHLQNPTGGRDQAKINLVDSTYSGNYGISSAVTGIRIYLNVNENMTGKISLYGLT